MEEKNVNEILEMLKELASNQATIVKCNAKLFALETEDKMSECVENARNYLNDKRNEYGVKIEKITTEYENETVNVDRILEKYKKRMGQVVEFFDDELWQFLKYCDDIQFCSPDEIMSEKEFKKLKACFRC